MIGADKQKKTHILAFIDLEAAARYLEAWCIFRDRPADFYVALSTLDGFI